jgi:poly(3-hydroxybutyrate) depolymerase
MLLFTMLSLTPSLSLPALLFTCATVAQLHVYPGCSKPLPQNAVVGKSQNMSIESGGLERSYRLHIPKSYDATNYVPLILSFHGRGKSAKQQEELSQFASTKVNPDAISVFPQGYMVLFSFL